MPLKALHFFTAVFRHNTARNPGADLSAVPYGFDLHAIRLEEGVRAALAVAAVLLLNELVVWPPLHYMALAAFLTCLSDSGGPIRTRVPAMLAFSVIGALIWPFFGVLRGAGLEVVLPLACLGLFCTSYARVWGANATSVGNLLSIVLILSLDQQLSFGEAAEVSLTFMGGALWACFVALVMWRLHPYRPARLAVAEVWSRLSDLSGDMLALTRRRTVTAAEWDDHARAYRRAVREEIEFARTQITDLLGSRGRVSARGAQALLRLEAADQIFGTLIALSDLLEDASQTETRSARFAHRLEAGEVLLRLLRPTLRVIAEAMPEDQRVSIPRLERVLAKIEKAMAGDPSLQGIAAAIADRLRVAAKLADPAGYLPGGATGGATAAPWRARILGPIRANLTWKSAMLRHALRVVAVGAPALAATYVWNEPFAHWLPITVVVTMQPFYGTTWQRALERIGGTVAGGVLGAALALVMTTPLLLALLMFPLCIAAFAARQVSFSAWIAGITPIVVVLMELIQPGHSSWEVAGMRALFTIAGGAMAVIGSLLLWPSWEPARLRQGLEAALAAHATYAAAVMRLFSSSAEAPGLQTEADAQRRASGVATNNLETVLSRALQEPGHGKNAALEAAMLADAILRRVAGRLSALYHDPSARAALPAEEWARWEAWLPAMLMALTTGAPTPDGRPDLPELEALARIARQVELLEGAMRRFRQPAPLPAPAARPVPA